jgi:hypothetical protein
MKHSMIPSVAVFFFYGSVSPLVAEDPENIQRAITSSAHLAQPPFSAPKKPNAFAFPNLFSARKTPVKPGKHSPYFIAEGGLQSGLVLMAKVYREANTAPKPAPHPDAMPSVTTPPNPLNLP